MANMLDPCALSLSPSCLQRGVQGGGGTGGERGRQWRAEAVERGCERGRA